MIFVVHRRFKEGLEAVHLLLDLTFIQWHQFKGQEFSYKLGKELFLLQLSRVHRLNDVEHVDLLVRVRAYQQVGNKCAEGVA